MDSLLTFMDYQDSMWLAEILSIRGLSRINWY